MKLLFLLLGAGILMAGCTAPQPYGKDTPPYEGYVLQFENRFTGTIGNDYAVQHMGDFYSIGLDSFSGYLELDENHRRIPISNNQSSHILTTGKTKCEPFGCFKVIRIANSTPFVLKSSKWPDYYLDNSGKLNFGNPAEWMKNDVPC